MTRAVLAALIACSLSSCSNAPAERIAIVDGGTGRVAGLEPVRVEARSGDDVVIRNANSGEASPVHAFVSQLGAPMFVPARGGVTPNSGVWGECRGGSAREALGTCPVAAIEGPARWDGSAYWSTGQILPGEERTVPLDPGIALGTHTLRCIFHPALTVQIAVVEAPVVQPPVGTDLERARATAYARRARGGRVDAGVIVRAPPAEVLDFHPQTIEIEVGDTVTWRAGSPSPHTVEFGAIEHVDLLDTTPPFTVPNVAGPWDGRSEVHSGFLSTDSSAPGSRFSLTFARRGTYRYVCRFHREMTGTVRVR